MEVFLSPSGDDKNAGDSPKAARLTLPELTPDPKDILHVWSRPGTKVTGTVDLSGWARVVMMPYVIAPNYGNGARLIRDWKEKGGKKPYFEHVIIEGSGFSLVNIDFGILDTREQTGKAAAKEEEPDEPVLVVIKGSKIGKWIADKWEVVQGTLDDVEFDEWDFGKTGVGKVVLTENTGEDGKPKGNVKIVKALKYSLKTGVKEENLKLRVFNQGKKLSWSNRSGGKS